MSLQHLLITRSAQHVVLGNTFEDKLQVGVEFNMTRMIQSGSPLPSKNAQEMVKINKKNIIIGSTMVGFNEHFTRETMVFDLENMKTKLTNLVLSHVDNQQNYSQITHSEGNMFELGEFIAFVSNIICKFKHVAYIYISV